MKVYVECGATIRASKARIIWIRILIQPLPSVTLDELFKSSEPQFYSSFQGKGIGNLACMVNLKNRNNIYTSLSIGASLE